MSIKSFNFPISYYFYHCQHVKDSWNAKKGVGVAENPRSGVGARGSSVKKGRMYGKICYTLHTIALPLLNFIDIVILITCVYLLFML
jgi:hypothetical protein